MARRVTPEEIVEMHRLYAKYGNYAAVGRELGRSGSTVSKYIKLNGTPDIVKHTFKEVVRGQGGKYIMKKLLCLLLTLVMCISLVACGAESSSESTTESVASKVKRSVESLINTKIAINYDTVGVPDITCYIDEVSQNNFEVSGKVTVKDKYGDSYSGKYDATVKYNPETDKCDTDVEIDTLYKVE